MDSELLIYSLLNNPGNPELLKTIKFNLGKDKEGNLIVLNVSAIATFGQKFLLIGMEKGHLFVVNINDYKIVANMTLQHKDQKNQIFCIQKTGEKNVYAIGTNKGLYMIRVNDQNGCITSIS